MIMNSAGNSGLNKLGRVLQRRIAENAVSSLPIEFGTIQEDYSLLTDTYPIPIVRSDYLVCRHLTQSDMELQSGDRVIVAWVQNDAVVIDVFLPADTETGG